DADGYAAGYGTLTWYTPEDMLETGSNVPRTHYRVSSRVSGMMVQGKLEEKPSRATAQAAIEPEKPKKKGLFSFLRPRRKPSPSPAIASPSATPDVSLQQHPSPSPTP